MNKTLVLLPYWILLFSIGFGWFIVAPLVPALMAAFGVSSGPIILLISVYGYAMVALGLLSGAISAKFTARLSLSLAALLSIVGLAGRAFSSSYTELFIFQIVAASAYPLAMAPVGSIATSINSEKGHTIIGISVGSLFLGMASGSFVGPQIFSYLGLQNTLIATLLLSVLAFILVMAVVRKYPSKYQGRSLKGSFEPGMLKNWYIGLIISSLAVMFSSIASESLINQNVSNALSIGGLFGGLSFLGSGLGAIILPPVFERSGALKTGLVITSVLSLVSIFMLSYFLAHFSAIYLAASGFFLFGFFGNSFWAMAMTSTTKYVKDPAQAGFATSMFSVATNLGVAFVPVFLGPFFLSNSTIGISIVVLMVLVAFAMSPTMRVSVEDDETVSGEAA